MIASEFKDADGFRLQFEESVTEEERVFYMRTFIRVDDVAKDRVHCTTCDVHVGTAPISEKIIRTHQILGVTQCNKCFAFYVSQSIQAISINFLLIIQFSSIEFRRVW